MELAIHDPTPMRDETCRAGLVVEGIDVSYAQKKVVNDVSLAIGANEIVALIGHNGAGKTTLLKAILGALRVNKGRIQFCGKDVTNQKPSSNVRDGIVYCPQGGDVFRRLTVVENLEIANLGKREGNTSKESIERIFDLFPALVQRRNLKAGVLSGGERQMLSIGMMLMLSPRLLLIDEPSGGLAPVYVDRVFESIKRINKEFQTAILVVEQNMKHAFEISGRVYVMRNSGIVFEGTPQQVQETVSEHFFGF